MQRGPQLEKNDRGWHLQGLLHMCVWFDHPEDEDAHLTFDAEFFGYFFMWVAHAIAQYQHCHGVPDQTAPLTWNSFTFYSAVSDQ